MISSSEFAPPSTPPAAVSPSPPALSLSLVSMWSNDEGRVSLSRRRPPLSMAPGDASALAGPLLPVHASATTGARVRWGRRIRK